MRNNGHLESKTKEFGSFNAQPFPALTRLFRGDIEK